MSLYTTNIYSHSTSLLQLKRCAITANGGVLILAVLHYSYSTPKSRTNDNNLDEQLIFIRITATVIGTVVLTRPSLCSKSAIFREVWHIVNLQPCLEALIPYIRAFN